MNSSGIAVKKIVSYFIPPPSEEPLRVTSEVYSGLYVIHDDLDIPLGEYKIQFNRSAAGHHGVESIIKELGTQEFWRIRIGIKNREDPASESDYSNRLIQPSSLPRRQAGMSDSSAGKYVLQKFAKKERIIIDSVIDKILKELNNALS